MCGVQRCLFVLWLCAVFVYVTVFVFYDVVFMFCACGVQRRLFVLWLCVLWLLM